MKALFNIGVWFIRLSTNSQIFVCAVDKNGDANITLIISKDERKNKMLAVALKSVSDGLETGQFRQEIDEFNRKVRSL